MRGCEKGLKGVPAALDASNLAADISRQAWQATHNCATNNNRQALVGRVERLQEELLEQVRALEASNADLHDRNVNLQATMEATNAIMLQLLAEPRGGTLRSHGDDASHDLVRLGGTRRGPPRDSSRASSLRPFPRDEERVTLFEHGGTSRESVGESAAVA